MHRCALCEFPFPSRGQVQAVPRKIAAMIRIIRMLRGRDPPTQRRERVRPLSRWCVLRRQLVVSSCISRFAAVSCGTSAGGRRRHAGGGSGVDVHCGHVADDGSREGVQTSPRRPRRAPVRLRTHTEIRTHEPKTAQVRHNNTALLGRYNIINALS